MKKYLFLLFVLFTTSYLFVSCLDSSYDEKNEYTCAVTFGNGTIRPDFEDSVYYVSDAEMERYDFSSGDRAIIRFTTGYTSSGGYAQGKAVTINEVLMRIPVSDLVASGTPVAATDTSAVTGFITYMGYSAWVSSKHLTVGVGYNATSEGTFTLAADTVRNDTACFTLYSKFSNGSTQYTQFYSYDLSSYINLNMPSFISKLNALDSVNIQVTTRYSHNDSIYNLVMVSGKYLNDFVR